MKGNLLGFSFIKAVDMLKMKKTRVNIVKNKDNLKKKYLTGNNCVLKKKISAIAVIVKRPNINKEKAINKTSKI